jgi:ornithine--oxo-acid transaminase
MSATASLSTEDTLNIMRRHGSAHYPLSPVVFTHALGVWLMDSEGRKYIDAASGYGSVGLGHNHPKVCKVITEMNTVTDTWGPVCVVPNVHATPQLADFLSLVPKHFGYEKTLVTNGGVEAVEAAIKLMRKRAYTKLGIPKGKAQIVVCDGNFHGRTTTVVGFSSESAYKDPFAPFPKDAFITIPFNSIDDLRTVLAADAARGRRIAGVLLEPVQGERGVRIPGIHYLREVAHVCKTHNIVFCADEIQTGLGRTGKLLASWTWGVKPDMVIIGKTLGGGKQAVAAVMGNNDVMIFEPGEHGSTYGGNPQSMAIASAALRIIKEERLCEKSTRRGADLLNQLRTTLSTGSIPSLIKEIRGIGLMIGIELTPRVDPKVVISYLLKHGVMTKDAHGVIRITPPLVITEQDIGELVRSIGSAFVELSQTFGVTRP